VPVDGPLWRDPWIQVRAAVLDHKIPCLAYRLTERDFYNVDPVALEASGLRPGPWLNELKHWVRAGRPAGGRVRIDGAEQAAEPLADRLLIHSRGRRIGYVADAGFTAANQQAIVELVRDVDLLYCEGAFLHADARRAAATHHLTARQAGELARRAGAGRLVVFHFSPKYEGRFEELEAEAQAALSGAGLTAPG
jgi:ribonuclease Z